jgi:hypothetical protein
VQPARLLFPMVVNAHGLDFAGATFRKRSSFGPDSSCIWSKSPWANEERWSCRRFRDSDLQPGDLPLKR